MITSDIRRLVTVEFCSSFESRLDEKTIDWIAVQVRLGDAIKALDVEIKDVCAFVGVDVSDPDALDQLSRLPKLKTITAVAGFLGVSLSWLLTGKGQQPFKEKPAISQAVSDTTDSTVVQGNRAGTLIVNNGAPQLSDHQRELLRIYTALPLRKQTKLLALAYELEEERLSS